MLFFWIFLFFPLIFFWFFFLKFGPISAVVRRCIRAMAFSQRVLNLWKAWNRLELLSWGLLQKLCACSLENTLPENLLCKLMSPSCQVSTSLVALYFSFISIWIILRHLTIQINIWTSRSTYERLPEYSSSTGFAFESLDMLLSMTVSAPGQEYTFLIQSCFADVCLFASFELTSWITSKTTSQVHDADSARQVRQTRTWV